MGSAGVDYPVVRPWAEEAWDFDFGQVEGIVPPLVMSSVPVQMFS